MPTSYRQRKALGEFGERLAVRQLVAAGYQVLDRNWRCRDGEIDIVAMDGVELVICEVKTRSSDRYGTPLEAITEVKASRLHRLGRIWAAQHDHRWSGIRVDVVTVVNQRRVSQRRVRETGPVQIDHVKGVC